MWLINICNCVLSPCACNFTVVIIESDAVFLLPQVSGREELEEKSAVHPAQRTAINMPTRYGVYFNRNLQTTTEYFFIYNLLNILQVAEISHHMDRIASIIFKGKSIIKSVDLA